jgi:hypothetical protein
LTPWMRPARRKGRGRPIINPLPYRGRGGTKRKALGG